MKAIISLSSDEKSLLKEIGEAKRYPLTRFELRSSKDGELRSTALSNVHLESVNDTMEAVKARGALLQRLSDLGYVLLDFRVQLLVASDYTVYEESAIYAQLCALAESGKSRPDYLFDIPHIKKGRVELTGKGKKAIHI